MTLAAATEVPFESDGELMTKKARGCGLGFAIRGAP